MVSAGSWVLIFYTLGGNTKNHKQHTLLWDELMDVIAVISGGLRAVFGFLLLLFVPGFTISLLFFPRIPDLRLIERLAYSTVLSIGSVIALVLFMDVFLGVNTTARNITLFILAFSALALIIWLCERWYMKSGFKLRLDSLISGDYHILRNYYNRLKDSIGNRIRKKENNL
jgi:hypothetical protein